MFEREIEQELLGNEFGNFWSHSHLYLQIDAGWDLEGEEIEQTTLSSEPASQNQSLPIWKPPCQ